MYTVKFFWGVDQTRIFRTRKCAVQFYNKLGDLKKILYKLKIVKDFWPMGGFAPDDEADDKQIIKSNKWY